MASCDEDSQKNADVRGDIEDEFPDLNQQLFEAFEPECETEPKPVCYPTQKMKARLLKDHIEYILKFYHGKTFADFDKLEIQLYTANSNSLEQQTLCRLLHPEAGCFSPEFYTWDYKSQYNYAKERVNKYRKFTKSTDRHKKLKKEVEEDNKDNNPKTLYVIVADEAHWGVSGKFDDDDGEQQNDPKAHDTFINDWNHDQHPNVVILQVSATPYNLLTKNKRLLDVKVGRVSVGSAGEPEMAAVKTERKNCFAYKSFKDHEDINNKGVLSKDTRNIRNLHYVEWSEGLLDETRDGMLVYLQVPFESGMLWVKTVRNDSPGTLRSETLRLETTEKENEKEEFLIISTDELYKIYTSDKKYRLAVAEKSLQKRVAMYPVKSKIGNDDFIIKTFGEDVVEIRVNHTDRNLTHNGKNMEITLERGPDYTDDLFPVHDVKYGFLIYAKRRWNYCQPGLCYEKQYLSLNHIYNSMRFKDPAQKLLRHDPCFDDLCKYVNQYNKRKDLRGRCKGNMNDRVLIAEYAMFVLLSPMLKKLSLQHTFSGPEFLQEDIFKSYYSQKKTKISEFLENQNLDMQIKEVFGYVRSYYETVSNVQVADELTMYYILFGNSAEEVVKSIKNVKEFTCNTAEDWQKFTANFESIKAKLLSQMETYKLVDDLAIEVSEETRSIKGHMKIVRVSRQESGDVFYRTICIARKIRLASENPVYFEVLRDYGSFKLSDCDQVEDESEKPDEQMRSILRRIRKTMQTKSCGNISESLGKCQCNSYKAISDENLTCKQCRHTHKNLNNYEDLSGLPCLLILVNKGRLGDTFPENMSTMDLRLMGKGTIASCVQQLGRLCRYTNKQQSSNKDYPFALLGTDLINTIEKELKKSATFSGALAGGSMKIDIRVTKEDLEPDSESKGFATTTTRKHFDHGNTEKHWNRILLKAEPQIGKTGVYLNMIKQLREIIERPKDNVNEVENESEVGEIESGSDDEYIDDTVEPDIETVEPSVKQRLEWIDLPYWKDMAQGELLKKYIEQTKYAPMYGPYEYGKKPEMIPFRDKKSVVKPGKLYQAECNMASQQYKALRIDHINSCSKCKQEPQVEEQLFRLSNMDVDVLISAPFTKQFSPVLRAFHMVSNEELESVESSCQRLIQPRLESWIFTPSYRRYDTASVNLAHSMIDDEGQDCSYVHILVVRDEEYSKYCEKYKYTHCIVKLPEIESVVTGGVGYVRKFIQKLSEQLELKVIFMMDDNMTFVIDARETEQMQGEKTILHSIPFYRVFKSMENFLLDKAEAPSSVEFDPYDEPYLSEMEKYTGPCKKYGVLGIKNYRPGSLRFKNIFKRTHVACLVAMNVRVLQKESIYFPEWPVFEDMNLNNKCDVRDIWVCKNHRYQSLKRQMLTWCPKVYTWNECTVLPSRNASLQLQVIDREKEAELAIKWLRETAVPSYIDNSMMVDDQWNYVFERAKAIAGKRSNKKLALITKEVLDKDFESLLTESDGVLEHVFFISADVCRKCNLTSHWAVDQLLSNLFETGYKCTVLTTHNVHQYRVEMVLVHVHGRGKKFTREEVPTDETVDTMETQPFTIGELEPCEKKQKMDPIDIPDCKPSIKNSGNSWNKSSLFQLDMRNSGKDQDHTSVTYPKVRKVGNSRHTKDQKSPRKAEKSTSNRHTKDGRQHKVDPHDPIPRHRADPPIVQNDHSQHRDPPITVQHYHSPQLRGNPPTAYHDHSPQRDNPVTFQNSHSPHRDNSPAVQHDHSPQHGDDAPTIQHDHVPQLRDDIKQYILDRRIKLNYFVKDNRMKLLVTLKK